MFRQEPPLPVGTKAPWKEPSVPYRSAEFEVVGGSAADVEAAVIKDNLRGIIEPATPSCDENRISRETRNSRARTSQGIIPEYSVQSRCRHRHPCWLRREITVRVEKEAAGRIEASGTGSYEIAKRSTSQGIVANDGVRERADHIQVSIWAKGNASVLARPPAPGETNSVSVFCRAQDKRTVTES